MNRLFPALAFFAAIGIFFVYIHPAWSGSIATANAAIAADNQALNAANTYVTQQNQLLAARNAIDPADLNRLEAFLPDSVNNVALILDLHALAAGSGLSLSNVDISSNTDNSNSNTSNAAAISPASSALGTVTTGTVDSVDLSLSAVGTYAALQSFLQGVERSQRLLDVRNLTVKSSNTGVYSYTMTIRLYWLP